MIQNRVLYTYVFYTHLHTHTHTGGVMNNEKEGRKREDDYRIYHGDLSLQNRVLGGCLSMFSLLLSPTFSDFL